MAHIIVKASCHRHRMRAILIDHTDFTTRGSRAYTTAQLQLVEICNNNATIPIGFLSARRYYTLNRIVRAVSLARRCTPGSSGRKLFRVTYIHVYRSSSTSCNGIFIRRRRLFSATNFPCKRRNSTIARRLLDVSHKRTS